MAARHYHREARFALRYQTHLTVVRLIGISRGAGVSACLVVVRLVAVRISCFGIQVAAVRSHAVAHRFQKFESGVDGSFCAIAAAVLPRPQDGTVSVIVLFTIVSSCVTDCNF